MEETSIWGNIQREIVKVSRSIYETKKLPEIDLFVAVIVRAGKDRDVDFFDSILFEHYCTFIKVNPIIIRNIVDLAWRKL